MADTRGGDGGRKGLNGAAGNGALRGSPNGARHSLVRPDSPPNASSGIRPSANLVPSPAPLDSADRRRHQRVAWEHHDLGPMVLEVEVAEQEWRRVRCTIVDLGAGGMGVLATEPLEPGCRVRLTFALPSRLGDNGREAQPGGGEPVAITPWTGSGEVVHTRHAPQHLHEHVPPEAHRPHHHGIRFGGLDADSELQLLRALYGPMPAGWAVERYTVRPARRPAAGSPAVRQDSSERAAADGARRHGGLRDEQSGVALAGQPPLEAQRYAVVREGKRVAWGFGTYDRARARAWSLHMDEQALAARRRRDVRLSVPE